MRDDDVMARIEELGLELPPAPKPLASYVPCVVHGATAWVAGQVPLLEGVPTPAGLLGADVTVDDGAAGARRAALQALSALRAGIGTFDRLERLMQVSVFVAATPTFVEHPAVANGASDLLVEVLGDEGRHARAAVGCASLPLGAAVEVALTAAVSSA